MFLQGRKLNCSKLAAQTSKKKVDKCISTKKREGMSGYQKQSCFQPQIHVIEFTTSLCLMNSFSLSDQVKLAASVFFNSTV